MIVGLVKESSHFFTVGLIYMLFTQTDIIMLSIMKDPFYVGYYEVSLNFIMPFLAITTLVSTVLFPVFSRNHPKSVAICNAGLKFLIIIGIPMSIGLFLIAPNATRVLFGSNYEESVKSTQILSFTYVMLFHRVLLADLLAANDKILTVMKVNGISMLVNIILNILLIPSFAHIGASTATAASTALNYVLFVYYTKKIYINIRIYDKFMRVLAAGVIMGVIIYAFGNHSIIIDVLLGFVSYSLSLMILMPFDRDETMYLKEMIKIRDF
jgi:O-antigen/teichoic acid export membrane protein